MMRHLQAGHARTLIDIVAAVAVFALSVSVVMEMLYDRELNPISYTLPPAAMAACGHGLSTPAVLTPNFSAFASRERSSISCADVIGTAGENPPTAFDRSYRYAIYSVATALRLGGVSWTALDAYVAALFGLSMVLTYVMYRYAAGPVVAVCGVLALVFSNHVLGAALDLRDSGKQIWFASLWLVLVWLLARGRQGASRTMFVPACVGGALLGIGVGFRMDLMVFAPAFVGVIIIGIAGWSRRAVVTKALAAAMFVVSLGIAGWPILSTLSGGSNFAHFATLGLFTPFTRSMGLEQPAYDVGDLYADNFALSVVRAHALLVQHEQEVGGLATKRYDAEGLALIGDMLRHFPADFEARALGATRQALIYPFDPVVRTEAVAVDALTKGSLRRSILALRIQLGDWLHGWELLVALVVFLVVAARDVRLALCGGALVFYFCSYSVVQFSRRHTFHLDVLAVGVMVVAAGLVVSGLRWIAAEWWAGRPLIARAPLLVRRLAVAGVVAMGVAIGGASVLWLTRAWQQQHVKGLIRGALASTWTEVSASRENVTIRPRFDPKVWSSALLLRARPAEASESVTDSGAKIRVSYLLVDVGGPQCEPGTVPMMLKYSSDVPTIDYDYTRAFDVPVSSSGASHLLAPVYEVPTARFEGIAVPSSRVDCIRTIRRAQPPSALALPVLNVVVPAATETMRLYQALRDEPPSGQLTPTVPPPGFDNVGRTFGEPSAPLGTPAPELSRWSPLEGVTLTRAAGAYLIEGTTGQSGYQIMSPAISVPPDAWMTVSVDGAADEGHVCFGVLEGSQQRFLLAPDERLRRLRFRTGPNNKVIMLFSNCGSADGGRRSRFTVRSITYEIAP